MGGIESTPITRLSTADGVTLTSSGQVLSIKNGGVGTTQLAAAAVTLTNLDSSVLARILINL